MTKEQKQGKFNAARVIKALGRIGYEPAFALLDIADNALSADASSIAISIEKVGMDEIQRGRKRVSIASFCILDNGTGMDADRLDNALTLGSSEQYYTPNTLSKFGMGLKSAAFSLGDCLTIISRHCDDLSTIRKVVLDYDRVLQTGQYIYDVDEPSTEEVEQLEAVCGSGSGTMIKITKPHINTLPPLADIIYNVQRRAGIVYYYYLNGHARPEKPLSLSIDGEVVQPFDPLFLAEVAGDLDELNWNGQDVRWITQPTDIQLDPGGKVYADLEITQLPHPPSVQQAGVMSRKECREKYMLDSGAYGFYVYRNHRLIAWPEDRAVKLAGERVKAADLYAFRGRLHITSDADDVLNLDMLKHHLQFAEIAIDQIQDVVDDAVQTSRVAWNRRTEAVKQFVGSTIGSLLNQELDRVERFGTCEDGVHEEMLPTPERAEREKIRRFAAKMNPACAQEIQRLREHGERVQPVAMLDNNQLWERAHDPADESIIARVNQSHRFYRQVVLDAQEQNPALEGVLSLLLFVLARGEYEYICQLGVDDIAGLLPASTISGLSEQDCMRLVEGLMHGFRVRVGATLSEMVRRMDVDAVFGESTIDE